MGGFATPGAFVLVAVVVALTLGFLWAQRRRRGSLVRFAGPELVAQVTRGVSWRRHVSAALVLVAILTGYLIATRSAITWLGRSAASRP